MARESFRALIPCGKPKTKTNNNGEYIKWKIERGRENGWRLGFHVVRHNAYIYRM
jgi:hypothetical protein